MVVLAPSEAINALQNSVKLRPQFAEAHYQLGQIYADKADSDPNMRTKAVERFQAAIAANPNYEPAQLALSRLQKTPGN